MIVVADASVLVAELLRPRGRALLAHPSLRVVVAEEQWEETEHELEKRIPILVERDHLSEIKAKVLYEEIQSLIDRRAIEVIPRALYERMEPIARRRVPRDARDWPPVALSLVLDAAILTGDNDFLGCGCPTWTVETLREELEKL